jgi:benzoylformate decarboxylase
MIRNYTKWDDQPASPQAAVESVLRANQISRTAPYGPVYICLDAGLQEAPLTEEISIPDAARFLSGADARGASRFIGASRQSNRETQSFH